MEAEKKTETIITLKLSSYESDLLKGIMQNPLFCEDPNQEDPTIRELRLNLFKALEWER